LATNGGNMTGWQIAGNVAMMGLSFAPALGAAGGAALKKLNGPDFLKLGGCFVAGTPVHLSASPAVVTKLELAYAATASDSYSYDLGWAWDEPHAKSALIVPIEQVPLGSRISTKNPEAFGAENPIPGAHESTWRLLSAEIEREDGAQVEVELLRPVTWIEEQGFTPGARIYLRLEELNVAGWATIRAVDPCPPLSSGHGNLVTGRFVTRGVTNLVEATFSDGLNEPTVLNGTSIHPVWSLDRLEWVPLGELAIGEQVYSHDGPLSLVARTSRNQPTDVYNIEVDCEHVYQVGNAGILVHNECGKLLGEAMSGVAGARKMWDKGKEAHHLIAEGLKGGKWDELRGLMVKHNIGLDDAANGMWLWGAKGKGRLSQLVHRGNGYHSHAMSNKLWDYLGKAKNQQDLRNKLAQVKQHIEDGTWWDLII
jgi:hypothetical protein